MDELQRTTIDECLEALREIQIQKRFALEWLSLLHKLEQALLQDPLNKEVALGIIETMGKRSMSIPYDAFGIDTILKATETLKIICERPHFLEFHLYRLLRDAK